MTDSRTGRAYNIPIERNSISAGLLKQIKAPESTLHPEDQNELGLRVFDPGFSNTAVSESKITYIDGHRGIITYRGYSIEDILKAKKGYVDTAHLLIWGRWPSSEERLKLHDDLNAHSILPHCVLDVIKAFP